ncbi:unnamed protein product [Polarella glacialis]|uniref:Uncharacterized protein n=1 Tax=Polarella glacialis TaxID=89957 RepID=A0A813E7U6_POLGL|nr:unnamed protein product [Polarella glacialis]
MHHEETVFLSVLFRDVRIFGCSCVIASQMEQGGRGSTASQFTHARSFLLLMLRGKSPCLGAESVSGRLQGFSYDAGGEASRGASTSSQGQSQQHRHAVSARTKGTN